MDKTEIIKRVGQNIKTIAKEKNLKTRHIAEGADMDVETLRKYLNGSMEMGISKLYRISRALDVDINELFKKN